MSLFETDWWILKNSAPRPMSKYETRKRDVYARLKECECVCTKEWTGSPGDPRCIKSIQQKEQ